MNQSSTWHRNLRFRRKCPREYNPHASGCLPSLKGIHLLGMGRLRSGYNYRFTHLFSDRSITLVAVHLQLPEKSHLLVLL